MKSNLLLQFAEAWSRKDIPAVMEFFTEDCSYAPSIVDHKIMATGKQEVAELIHKMILHDHARSTKVFNMHIHGNFGFWEWEYTTENDVLLRGCDIFEFDHNKIKIKNAFRKIDRYHGDVV